MNLLGKMVTHKIYGSGKVTKIQRGGYYVRVSFQNGSDKWLRYNEIIEIKENIPQKSVEKVTQSINILPTKTATADTKYGDTEVYKKLNLDDPFVCRRMIEAFRLGIVPYDCIDKFTFGRDNEIKAINNWIGKGNTNNLFLFGSYGSGKTHLLQYLAYYYLNQGYATAFITIDNQESPFQKPKRIFSKLAHSFKYMCRKTQDILSFRDFVLNSLEVGGLSDHRYFNYLQRCDDELLWGWIECNESYTKPLKWVYNDLGYKVDRFKYLPSLFDYGTAANVYCNLISGLGYSAIKYMGLKGLVVFFDEGESINHIRGVNFLKSLTYVTNNIKELTEQPYYSNINYNMGLTYALRAKDIPFIYKIPSGLKCIYAFTDDILIQNNKSLGSFDQIDLTNLSDITLKNIQRQLCELYTKAYRIPISPQGISKLLDNFNNNNSNSTRSSIKTIVEFLDISRYNQIH